MTKALQTLIGKHVEKDVPAKDLEKMAKKAGFSRCQLREPGYFYDCQYDMTRLQVHVDKDKKIISLLPG